MRGGSCWRQTAGLHGSTHRVVSAGEAQCGKGQGTQEGWAGAQGWNKALRPSPRPYPTRASGLFPEKLNWEGSEKQDPSSLKVLLSVRSLLFNYPTEQSMEKMIMKVKNTEGGKC